MRFLWIIAVVLAGAAAAYLFTRFESSPPFVQTRVDKAHIGAEHVQEIRVSDDQTGVESVRIWLEAGGESHELHREEYPGNLFTGAELFGDHSISVTIRPRELEIPDGPATLHVEARDFSWRGNVGTAQVPFQIDSHPPRLALRTGLTYVRRGGAEAVVYSISEGSRHHGVDVGGHFFPGFPHPADPARSVAFYAIPPDLETDANVRVVARDLAGNEAAVNVPVKVIERSFPEDQITLSEEFMARKVAELGGAAADGTLDAYLAINRDLRAQNAQQIREICSESSEDRLWSRTFLQLPASRVGARFADRRTYLYDGRSVDRQVHLGFDFASTAHAPVPAANDGVVVFAGELGIYGNTVILDHGLGLFSMYGHLSEIGVDKGRAVGRGDPVGRTGQTGLAGGDHLHFAVLVSGVFVDPLEWFDERWIQEHLEPKLTVTPEPEAPAS